MKMIWFGKMRQTPMSPKRLTLVRTLASSGRVMAKKTAIGGVGSWHDAGEQSGYGTSF
jgi:hypothetical protein